MRKITDEENAKRYGKYIEEYKASDTKTIADIARENNLSYPSFYAYAKKLDVIKDKPRKTRKANQKTIDSIVERYKSNIFLSAKDLAKEYGVCYQTIVRWLTDAGIDIIRKKTIDEKTLKRALEYYDKGMNVKSAARKARVGKNTLRDYLKANGLIRHSYTKRNISFDKTFFDFIDTEEKAYWLGFIFADGYVKHGHDDHGKIDSMVLGIELSEKDEDMLVKFNQSISGNLEIKHRIRESRLRKGGKTSKMCSVIACSTHMCESLAKTGCIRNKTYDGYLNLDTLPTRDLRIHFMRGYIDGDGYVSGNHNCYDMHIVVHNHNVMNALLRIMITDFDVIPRIKYESDDLGGAYRMHVSNKKDFFKFLDQLYHNANIMMERKYQNYLSYGRPESKVA